MEPSFKKEFTLPGATTAEQIKVEVVKVIDLANEQFGRKGKQVVDTDYRANLDPNADGDSNLMHIEITGTVVPKEE